MKKFLLLIILPLLLIQKSFAQTGHVQGTMERKMTDSLCVSISKLDVSKIKTQEEAVAAYTQCVGDHIDLLGDFAAERNVDMTDKVAMKKIGVDLAFNLYKMKCENFIKLSTLMAMKTINKDERQGDISIGAFKRIENKGFNYIVITDAKGNEQSFLWLRQFPGSENFMNGITKYVGKKLSIGWKELEVYLPQAKGYYKVKEIVSLDIQ
jgi:hypothetical protein